MDIRPRVLCGEWDWARARRFNGCTIAFQVFGKSEWFTGVVRRDTGGVTVSGWTGRDLPLNSIVKAVVLSDIR
jgi:hypothetical protein